MNFLRSHFKPAALLLGLCGIAAALAGCKSALQDEPTFSDVPAAPGPAGAAPTVSAPAPGGAATNIPIGRFRVGDTVVITFSGVDPMLQPPPFEGRITDDGTITLNLLTNSVVAAGKTPGELQKEIHGLYVPKFFNRLVVNVRGFDLFYFVDGEVRNPSQRVWSGEVTVTQTIAACGGFTDFANKAKVMLIRPNGEKIKVDCKKAITHPELDIKVLPGDKIVVPRRLW